MITGVRKGSKAYKAMQNSQLRLLDIITKVDSTSCKDLTLVADTQKTFDDKLQHGMGHSIMKNICRSESLAPHAKLISQGKI